MTKQTEERNKNTFLLFLETFEQLALQKATFDFFGATFEQLFEKFRAPFWEISINLWQALVANATTVMCNSVVVYFLCLLWENRAFV